MRSFVFCCCSVLFFATSALGEPVSSPADVIRATYRLEHPKTTGTAFVVRRTDPANAEATQLLLVTTAHAVEAMDTERAALINRAQDEASGDWEAKPVAVTLRRDGQPLWRRHPRHDVAVLPLELTAAEVQSLPLDVLASAEDWNTNGPEAGSLIRSIGFPHAAQFKPSKAAFPLTRLGCIATYSLTPYAKHPMFLVDYNTFEGDSGAPVYWETTVSGERTARIIGLVQGQHFIDERYELVYQRGQIRKRLGLAIAVNSQAILETIKGLAAE